MFAPPRPASGKRIRESNSPDLLQPIVPPSPAPPAQLRQPTRSPPASTTPPASLAAVNPSPTPSNPPPAHQLHKKRVERASELSRALALRLEYSNFKLQRGWSKQRFEEVENLEFGRFKEQAESRKREKERLVEEVLAGGGVVGGEVRRSDEEESELMLVEGRRGSVNSLGKRKAPSPTPPPISIQQHHSFRPISPSHSHSPTLAPQWSFHSQERSNQRCMEPTASYEDFWSRINEPVPLVGTESNSPNSLRASSSTFQQLYPPSHVPPNSYPRISPPYPSTNTIFLSPHLHPSSSSSNLPQVPSHPKYSSSSSSSSSLIIDTPTEAGESRSSKEEPKKRMMMKLGPEASFSSLPPVPPLPFD